jgi:hypothetical protein
MKYEQYRDQLKQKYEFDIDIFFLSSIGNIKYVEYFG